MIGFHVLLLFGHYRLQMYLLYPVGYLGKFPVDAVIYSLGFFIVKSKNILLWR